MQTAVAAEDNGPQIQPNVPTPGSNYLFSSGVEPVEKSADVDTRGTIRSRTATVNIDRLRQKPGEALNKRLLLNLFDDVVVRAKRTKNYTNPSKSSTWIGEVEDTPDGITIFILRDNVIYGIVELPHVGKFSIYPNPDGTHTIEQIDEGATLSGEDDSRIPDSSTFPSPDKISPLRAVEISNDDGSIIDVFVAYDQDASGGAVAAADAQSYAELFIAYTNQAYENSNMNQRAWLVGVDGFNYTDPDQNSLNADLDAATDGTISGLHAKRDEYHADLVLFFTPYTGPSCSGLAWVQTYNNNVGWNVLGFSAMEACSFGQGVFAHELGHNMGSRHDWYMDDSTSPASIGHGYVDIYNGFRTIMSYGNRCSAASVSCPQISHFANPLVNYGGATTGVTSGTSSSCAENAIYPVPECDADNTTNFDTKAPTTAQFRGSRLTWTGAVSSSWTAAGNWTINEGAPGSTTAVNRVPRSFDNIYIPSGLATYPTVTGSVNARELVIEDGAALNMTSGTLTVGWSWEDEGGFNATGGKVVFSGPFGVAVTSASAFNDVQIGTGSDSSVVSLESDIDIDGNLDIMAGASFNPGAYTVNISGDWTEADATGFNPGSSSVIFDGTSQTVNKTADVTLLTEDFSAYDSICCTSGKPSGWANSDGAYYQGDLVVNGDGAANRWRNQTDGYLYTPALSLQAGIVYQLQYDVAIRRNYSDGDGLLSSQTVSVHLGDAQSSAAMTTILSAESSETSTSYQTRTINNITVASSGTYYVGFRAQQTGDDYTSFDDISLSGTGSISFHDLQVASGLTTFNGNVAVSSDLQTNSGATADFSTNEVTVEATVTNNGSIKQTRTAANGITTAFAHIQNAAGTTDKYFGVEITPSSGSMGSTTVAIQGSGTVDSVNRSYEITPGTSQTALSRFYYHVDDQNGQTNPKVFHWNGTSWDDLDASLRGGSGAGMYVETTTTSYSPFVLADATPTRANIGKVSLRYVPVGDAIEHLAVADDKAEVYSNLLTSLNPDLAATLAGADIQSLLSALVRELDPDTDGMVAVFAWETLEERGTIGFYAERRTTDKNWKRLNNDMLPGMIDAPMGAEYMLFDPEAGQLPEYLYRLIEVEARGTKIQHGPWLLQLKH